MNHIKKLLINDFAIKKAKIDMMGYKLERIEQASFHHLLIKAEDGGKIEYWNGSILNSKTSHPYLHLIEYVDFDYFAAVTSEILDIKAKGCIDEYNLRKINDILLAFECRYGDRRNAKGKKLIKPEYLDRIYNNPYKNY